MQRLGKVERRRSLVKSEMEQEGVDAAVEVREERPTSFLFQEAFIQSNPLIYTVSRWKYATISFLFSPMGWNRLLFGRFTNEVAVSLKINFFSFAQMHS